MLKDCSSPLCLALPTLVWILINMALVFVGAYLVTFHAVCVRLTFPFVENLAAAHFIFSYVAFLECRCLNPYNSRTSDFGILLGAQE